ncbi:Protein CHLOROPLAST IMPORT APPARATUS 2 like [Quillaja saponaria]|uniref:Protein CHLOROPLAST IMPORT APPARATUS 2 like n=1 Tax=Quillaja saponaria TaxID=32244 RepID=A0AAD7LET3_QUISA|nr:Protein CHLOROPLAST IMPORT APPARATUS 2 like [Quillaja saponaria]
MSSCLSGAGGRTYGLDLEFVKSPSTSTRTSHTSSPSSTISESSNSPLAISTRKPRTPRKRPNQIYNEAAALLSTAYPNIFSTNNLTKPCKLTKQNDTFFDESGELLLPFQVIDSSAFLLRQPIQEKPTFPIESKVMNLPEKPCPSPGEINSRVNSLELGDECDEDFDAESILDEEIEEGIDSIMGDRVDEPNGASCYSGHTNSWCGNPMGFGFGGKFDLGFGFRRGGVRAMRHVDEGNWWCFPTVDIREISPRIKKAPASVSAEKKKKKVEKPAAPELKNAELPKENSTPKSNPGLLLKLNHEEVLKSWSDRGSPFSDEIMGSELSGSDVYARLAHIDLFSDNGGVREASVLRYKEKRRTRLFSKKIRYQVRKVNADRRPRMKGRFVRRPNCSTNGQR